MHITVYYKFFFRHLKLPRRTPRSSNVSHDNCIIYNNKIIQLRMSLAAAGVNRQGPG